MFERRVERGLLESKVNQLNDCIGAIDNTTFDSAELSKIEEILKG